MWAVIKSSEFSARRIKNPNELIPWVNDSNVTTLPTSRGALDSVGEKTEVELFSNKIKDIIAIIVADITSYWQSKNARFKYFKKDGLDRIEALASSLNDRIFISWLLMKESLDNEKSETHIDFTDEKKLEIIKEFLINQYKNEIEAILEANSLNNALIYQFTSR